MAMVSEGDSNDDSDIGANDGALQFCIRSMGQLDLVSCDGNKLSGSG